MKIMLYLYQIGQRVISMITIKDIAEKLGVAVSTVSKGLNGASDISDSMRQLVLDTAVEMGYASKKMRNLGSRRVCIFIENTAYDDIDQFGYEIIVGFKQSAARRHWDVTVVPMSLSKQAEENFDSYILKNGFSGAFLLGFTLHEDWIKQLGKTSVPTVLLDNYIAENNHTAYVGTDNEEGIDLAVGHLKGLGHSKIAFLNDSNRSVVSAQRQQAFINSMHKHGLVPDDNLIQYGYSVSNSRNDPVPALLQNGTTAIICGNDLIAISLINKLKKQDIRIPEDISIIGFDDLPIAAQSDPPLTTIRQNRIDLGKSALLLLDGLISNVATSRLLLRARFMPRNTTGPV